MAVVMRGFLVGPLAAGVDALVTPCGRPVWRGVWGWLALGLVLRLYAAWTGHWFWRVDEIYQYLEQAHRVVFGYGFIPWEMRYGVRSWLTAGWVLPPLFLCQWLGWEHPQTYATVVQLWNALWSMTLPIAVYAIGRRMMGEAAGRWALVFVAVLWYEFVIFAPRTLSEIYGAYALLAGMALGAGTRPGRWGVAGFLMGVALAFRPHYALLVGPLGLLWLWRLPARLGAAAVGGGGAALLGWGALDWVTLGGWWASLFNYLHYIPLLFGDVYDKPRWLYLWQLTVMSFGGYALVAAMGAALRLWLPLLLAATLMANLLLPPSQEYSNLFVYLPLLWLLAGGVLAKLAAGRRWRKAAAGLAAVGLTVVSAVGAMGALPMPLPSNMAPITTTREYFSVMPPLKMAYRAHELIEREDARSALVIVNGLLEYGGYYALHRNIPVFGLSDTHNLEARHRRLYEKYGQPPLREFAHYVIARNAWRDPAFVATPLLYQVAFYANRGRPAHPLVEEWVYDYMHPSLRENEKIALPAALTPYAAEGGGE